MVDDARRSATLALELAQATGAAPPWILASWALGHTTLALGDAAGAVESFAPLLAHHDREEIREPGALPFMSDAIEALVEAGRLEDARRPLETYEATAERLGRHRGIAAARRCRGLLAAAAGDLPDALRELHAAVELASHETTPFECARALLALGVTQRRANRRREGRETLQVALGTFERVGAALWAERTRVELSRLSGRTASPGALTPAEERVAALVAEGKTNREVAAALFLSERTVEGHLTHVYGKLGVRSRAELAHVLASGATQVVVSSNPGDFHVSGTPPAP
jgi:DNA-binding CsgD family transcriptional regulator